MRLSLTTRNSALSFCTKHEIHYGWVMVALAFFSALFATASVVLVSMCCINPSLFFHLNKNENKIQHDVYLKITSHS